MMQTIQLQLPRELVQEVETVSHDLKGFIVKAVSEKLDTLRNHNVDALLVEGYQATRDEDLEITRDFETADFEHWK